MELSSQFVTYGGLILARGLIYAQVTYWNIKIITER